MRYIILLIFAITLSAESNVVECNKIFETRKDEMFRELDRIDEKQLEYELYKDAKLKIIEKEAAKVEAKKAEIDEILKKAKQLKKEADDLHKKNETVLKNIKNAKSNKIAKTYIKMKDSKAAAIFDTMKKEEAARILFTLPATKLAKILAKMLPQNASDITGLIEDNRAFENNTTK